MDEISKNSGFWVQNAVVFSLDGKSLIPSGKGMYSTIQTLMGCAGWVIGRIVHG